MTEFKITRMLAILALSAPLALAACDDDEAAIDTDSDGDADVVVEE